MSEQCIHGDDPRVCISCEMLAKKLSAAQPAMLCPHGFGPDVTCIECEPAYPCRNEAERISSPLSHAEMVKRAYHYRQPDWAWTDDEVAAFAEMEIAGVSRTISTNNIRSMAWAFYQVFGCLYGIHGPARIMNWLWGVAHGKNLNVSELFPITEEENAKYRWNERDSAQKIALRAACLQVTEICEDGDSGADFGRVIAAMQRCAEALNASGPSRPSEGLEQAARELLDAMETCHICKGALILEEHPVHCEDCSGDCENHEEPECTPIYVLHANLRKALARHFSGGKGAELETTCAEETAIGQLMESQGLSRAAVWRQALRTYQLVATGHAKLITEIWGKKNPEDAALSGGSEGPGRETVRHAVFDAASKLACAIPPTRVIHTLADAAYDALMPFFRPISESNGEPTGKS